MSTTLRYTVALALYLCVASAVAALQPVSLQLKWKHSFQFAGFYMAQEKGFYRQAGLTTKFLERPANSIITGLVGNGKATYGVGDSILIRAKLNGQPVVALAAILQHSPLALITLESSNIKRPEDVAGKKVMMAAGWPGVPLISMLKSHGVSLDQISMQPNTFNLDALIDGSIDAAAIYTTNEPWQLESRNIGYRLLKPRDSGFDFYGDILFTTSTEVLQQPARTRAFYEASIKGWNYAFSHIDEAVSLVFEKYNPQKISRDRIRYEANIYRQLSGFDSGSLGQISSMRIQAIANVYRLLQLAPDRASVEGFRYRASEARLSSAERKFVETHPLRVISTNNWGPFNVSGPSGKLSGIAVDFWKLIARKTGLRSSYQVVDSWPKVVAAIRDKTADLTLSTSLTDEREKYALFSKPYASFPIAIATTYERAFIGSPVSLGDRTLAVGKGFSAHKILRNRFPVLNLVPVRNIAIALEMVSRGKVFAAADILPVLTYEIGNHHQGLGNLKISGTTDFNFDVRIMTTGENPELVRIIDKGIDAISDDERQKIFRKWAAISYEPITDYSLLWKIGLPLLALLILALVWIYTLRRENKRRKVAEAKLGIVATTDPLTQIHNRYRTEKLLEEQWHIFTRHGRSFSVLFIDLDGFKAINDRFGHETGDITLQEFARLIELNIRKIDYLGRWGGEEFLVLLPDTTLESAMSIARKLVSCVDAHPFPVIEQLNCSIGCAQIEPGDNIDTLVDRADRGLYRAKEQGKNQAQAGV